MKRKKTLRRLPPLTRQLYRLTGEMQSVIRRMENLAEKLQTAEMESISLHRMMENYKPPAFVADEQTELFPEEDSSEGGE